jgi:hypothetical protein
MRQSRKVIMGQVSGIRYQQKINIFFSFPCNQELLRRSFLTPRNDSSQAWVFVQALFKLKVEGKPN